MSEGHLEKIGNYQLITELTNKNSGFGKWGFAVYEGKQYFIKQFLSPVYPDERMDLPADIRNKRIQECKDFFDKKNRLYEAIARAYNGNIIKIEDFFLYKSHFYITTDKVDTASLDIKDIAEQPYDKKLLILKVLANNLCQLSAQHVVHGDLKPENILVKRTVSGFFTAKIIDFDSSFFANEIIEDSEDINGDMVYLAPETFKCMIEEEDHVDEKVDVFALGILFHQYMTGELPLFDHTQYDYMYEAALNDEDYMVSESLPKYMQDMIKGMLRENPEERLDIQEVLTILNTQSMPQKKEETEAKTPETNMSGGAGGATNIGGDVQPGTAANPEGAVRPGMTPNAGTGTNASAADNGWGALDGFGTPELNITPMYIPKGNYSASGPGETGEHKPENTGSMKISGNLKWK